MSETPDARSASTEETGPPTPEVVAVLVENHRRFLSFLERRVGSREAAEDILQEAFVRGLTRGSGLREGDSAVAWFYRVLRNAIVDHWRRVGAERRAMDRAAALADAPGHCAPSPPMPPSGHALRGDPSSRRGGSDRDLR